MKIKKIFIGRRPARETPRNQGGGPAKRHSCQALNDADGGKNWGIRLSSVDCQVSPSYR